MGGTFKKLNGVECCDPSPVTIYFSGSLDGGVVYLISSSISASLNNVYASQSNYVLTSSFNAFTSSIHPFTASYYQDSVSFNLRINNVYASQSNYATTQSNTFRGDQVISGSVYITGSIYANRLIVNVVSSSIIYSSGSNIFGDSLADTHEFTGSVYVTGALQLNGHDVLTKPNVSGSATQVAFFTGPNTVNGDNSLWWDNTNKRLGINKTTPSYNLHVSGSTFSEQVNYTLDSTKFGVLGSLSSKITGSESNQYLNAGVAGEYSIDVSSPYSPQDDAKIGGIVSNIYKIGNGQAAGHISSIRAFSEVANSGSITQLSGIRIYAPKQIATQGVFNGIITQSIGLYIDDISGSSDVADRILSKTSIFQAGSEDRNYFAGYIQVGKYTNGVLGVDTLGNLRVVSGSTSTGVTSSAGTNNIISANTGSYTAAFYNYTVSSASNARSGTIQTVWNGTSIQFNEVTTLDIGSTTPVTMSVVLSGGNVVLQAQTGNGGWIIKSTANFL